MKPQPSWSQIAVTLNRVDFVLLHREDLTNAPNLVRCYLAKEVTEDLMEIPNE